MIFGRVLDPQSGAVASARVTITNNETNTSRHISSNATGYYEANLLLPGGYTVTVEATGFKRTVRGGVQLPAASRREVDLVLEIGPVTESVSVTAESPLLDLNSVSSGRVIENRDILDLPVMTNSPMVMVKLMPGIQTEGINPFLAMHSIFGASLYNASSANVGGNEWSIDGVPNNGRDRLTASLPTTDTLQEFKVESANFDVSIGHTTGASISMLTKSGTNQFHGTVTEQHWQQRWNGTAFFTKQNYYRRISQAEAQGNQALAETIRAQDKQPSAHANNFTGTFGGPVILPKIYNGKNKLFFFVSYNGYRDNKTIDAANLNRTVPTMAIREGDFSQMLKIDAVRYQVYDPLSVRADPARAGHYIRDAFAGNVIPKSRIVNPAYSKVVKFYPVPNNDPLSQTAEPRNNFLAYGQPSTWTYNSVSNRVDYQLSDRHRFFGRWSWMDHVSNETDWTYASAPGLMNDNSRIHNVGATFDWVWTRSAATLFNFSVAANEYKQGTQYLEQMKYKPSDLGLPAYMDAKADDLHTLPIMSISGYSATGSGVGTLTRYRTATIKSDVSHVHGIHTFRAGIDFRDHFRSGGGGGNTSGSFSFSNSWVRRNDDTYTTPGDIGLSWAAFLLGLPDNGWSVASNDNYVLSNPYYAWFAQDSLRVNSKLTLTLGLRAEYELGPAERFDRAIAYFDPTLQLPITALSEAAYTAKPVPERDASTFKVLGGSVYAGPNGAGHRLQQNELMWLPRVGAAYAVNAKTVVRAGYGLFFDTNNVLNQSVDQMGYSRNTTTTLTNDYGMTWLVGNPGAGVSPLTDPFPVRSNGTRFDAPVRDTLGAMAAVGRGWSYVDYNTKHARQQRWRAGVQRQIGASAKLDIAYAGSYSDRIAYSRTMVPLPGQYWTTTMVRNDANATNLDANVTNPFYIGNFASLKTTHPVIYQDMSTNSFFTSSTIRKSLLLRTSPQMNGVNNKTLPLGEARTHSLEMSFERRFAKGFNLNLSYARIQGERNTFLNEYDVDAVWIETNEVRPHRFTGTGIFELPFGKGRPFAKQGLLSWIVGGFQLAATYEWQPGPRSSFSNCFFYGNLSDISTGTHTLDRWFNTDNFGRTTAQSPARYTARIFPLYVDGVRRDRTNQWNVNLQREFPIAERAKLQMRVDALNLQNRSQFSDPTTDPLNTNFGKVTSQLGTNRFIQIQMRLQF